MFVAFILSAPQAASLSALTGNATSTTLECAFDGSFPMIGGKLTCTAKVLDKGTLIPPTTPAGLVNFISSASGDKIDGNPCELASTGSDTSSCKVTITYAPPDGLRTITAFYDPDNLNHPNEPKNPSSGTLGMTVYKRPTETSFDYGCRIGLTDVLVTTGVGDTLTCTVYVVDYHGSSPGPSPITGTVTITDTGPDIITPCTLTKETSKVESARCSFMLTGAAPIGSRTITAKYSGDATYNASSSRDFTLTILKHPTVLKSILCIPGEIIVGQMSTCTVTIDDGWTAPSTPTGSVAFTVAPSETPLTLMGSPCTLSKVRDGEASCSVTVTGGLPLSGRLIYGEYTGDASHNRSESSFSSGNTGSLLVTNTRRVSTMSSCTPKTLNIGDSTTCTLTVNDIDVGTASAPTGKVNVILGGSSSPKDAFTGNPCTLSGTGAFASCTVTFTPAEKGGERFFRLEYPGDPAHFRAIDSEPSYYLTVLYLAPDVETKLEMGIQKSLEEQLAGLKNGGSAILTFTFTDPATGGQVPIAPRFQFYRVDSTSAGGLLKIFAPGLFSFVSASPAHWEFNCAAQDATGKPLPAGSYLLRIFFGDGTSIDVSFTLS
ncbi:Ig-like domain repeat protein [Candidatus Acetothermia bacterium]|nr:Ig-like domain repeat protein [Candidatus Acetothermia bacterium]MBI3644288.1 Ig-like domain repeat protein [Candidatus Acetothermia bacterium]